MTFEIQDAVREHALLRLALSGSSGAGKSIGSLLIAKGLISALLKAGVLQGSIERKIGLIDTERKSSRFYAHVVPFKVIELDPPFTVDRYIGALETFEAAGFPLVIIDQISHAWAGKGGLLEAKDQMAKGGETGQWNAWAEITPVQNEFIDRLLRSPAHLICTLRSKTAWTTEEYTDRNGHRKSRPKRIGMAPVQRPGTEYEFSSLLNLETDTNFATVLKDRTEVFAALNETPQRLSEKWGERLAAWLYEGRVAPPIESTLTPSQRSEAGVKVWESSFARAPSLPDLAVEFEKAIAELRSFGDTIGGYHRKTLTDRLIVAKDKRKAALVPAPAAGAIADVGSLPIDHLEVTLLEDLLREHNVPVDAFTHHFGIVRIIQLPPLKMDEARAWIVSNSKRSAAA